METSYDRVIIMRVELASMFKYPTTAFVAAERKADGCLPGDSELDAAVKLLAALYSQSGL